MALPRDSRLADSETPAALYRIVLRNLASGREQLLYEDPDLASEILALSPDGDVLLFGIAEPEPGYAGPKASLVGGGRLMTMPAAGGEARELIRLQGPGRVRTAFFSSDGDHVLFLRNKDDGTEMVRVPREGAEAQVLWATDVTLVSFTPSPDRRRAIVQTRVNEGDVFVMDDLGVILEASQVSPE